MEARHNSVEAFAQLVLLRGLLDRRAPDVVVLKDDKLDPVVPELLRRTLENVRIKALWRQEKKKKKKFFFRTQQKEKKNWGEAHQCQSSGRTA